MGSLTFPSGGLVYADRPTFIYTIEQHPLYEPLLRPLWSAFAAGDLGLVTSELTLLEVLVQPEKTGNTALAQAYNDLLLAPSLRLVPVDQAVLRAAARLRAATNLKTPDAIHAATALSAGCTLLVTNDPAFRRVPELPLAFLDDILAA